MAYEFSLLSQHLIGSHFPLSGVPLNPDELDLPNHLVDLVLGILQTSIRQVQVIEFTVTDQCPKDAYSHLIQSVRRLHSERALCLFVHGRTSHLHIALWRRNWPDDAIHADLDFSQLSLTDRTVVDHLRQLNPDSFDAVASLARSNDSRDRFRNALRGFLKSAVPKPDLQSRRAVVELMLQLVFLVFVQRKGWLNGDPNYLQRTFGFCHTRGLSIMHCFLKPLFARLEGQRIAEFMPMGNLPRLGGGLFNVESANMPVIDNRWLLDFMDSLSAQFSFSLFEARQGRTVFGVSPEILGHVFEHLLTGRQRKVQGVFYTPYEVAARQAQVGLDQLFENHMVDAKDLEGSRRLLARIRVFDPSCGSGTYLVAAFQCLLDRWLAVSPNHERSNGRLFELKQRIVCHQLFGLDIQPTAVKLTEVRLWLNMIQDIDVADPEMAPSLPNLSHHIRHGDFLYQPGQIDSKALRSWPKLQQLNRLRRKFPHSSIHRRNSTLRHILRLESELQMFIEERERSAQLRAARVAKSQQSLPFQRNAERFETPRSSSWAPPFRPYILFSEPFMEGGFDLIVGNPPWLSGTRIHQATKRRIRSILTPREKKVLPGHADYSLYFFVVALRLLRDRGQVGILVPGKLLQARYAAALRGLLAGEYRIDYLVDYGKRQGTLFNADTFPLAMGVSQRKEPNPNIRIACDNTLERTSWRISQSQLDDRVWTLRKESQGAEFTVADLAIPIQRGVVTNAKRLFTFDSIPNGLDAGRFKPLLSGRDIQPHSCAPGRWIYWPEPAATQIAAAEVQWLASRKNAHIKRGTVITPYRLRAIANWLVIWKYLARKPICALWRNPEWIPDQTTYYIQTADFATAFKLFYWLNRPQTSADLASLAERGKDGCFFFYAHTMAQLPIDQQEWQQIRVPEATRQSRWLATDLS